MADIVTQIAAGVADELNNAPAETFSLAFEAQRLYRPTFELEDLEGLTVSVVPKGINEEIVSRRAVREEVQVDVAVQKKLQAADNAEIDALVNLVREIVGFFRFRVLATCPDALWVRTENVPLYSVEHMDRYRVFTSVITLSYRVIG